MKKSFEEALADRRSYYRLGNEAPVPDAEVVRIVHEAVKHVPSAFNSQSTRIVVLFGEEHRRLWNLVKDTLREMLPADVFARTDRKIDDSFAGGHGTVLFFEDTTVVAAHQDSYPLYAENFKVWSEQTSAMHQLAVWVMLEDLGFGASLQHYNPLIDAKVQHAWSLPKEWRLIAQMPFGMPLDTPEPKTFKPLDGRVLVFPPE